MVRTFALSDEQITKAGLAERDNYKTPHLDVAARAVN
jgi:hypothetical protein